MQLPSLTYELLLLVILLLVLYHRPPQRPRGKRETLAVLFSDTGLGDVGKHIVAKALRRGLKVRAVSISSAPETLFKAISWTPAHVDYDEDLLRLYLQGPVDLAAANATAILRDTFEGVDGIVVAAWNRQLGYPHEAARGMPNVVRAATAANIKRLAMVSSSNFLTSSFYCGRRSTFFDKALDLFLRLPFRHIFRDLEAAEADLRGSKLDYVILKPCGLDPSEVPRGKSTLRVHTSGEKPPELWALNVAKEDIADVVLDEMLKPTVHKGSVSIGRVSDVEK